MLLRNSPSPEAVTAPLLTRPAASDTTPLRPKTGVGRVTMMLSSMPACPSLFRPLDTHVSSVMERGWHQ
eukprot:1161121-Pelagomonas_calceolata.AAC.1